MKPEELLDRVTDGKSFMEFALALVEDRESAEEMERANPDRWKWGGANNWQNSSISSFLSSAIAGVEARACFKDKEQPNWRDFAEFLYLGKIYE